MKTAAGLSVATSLWASKAASRASARVLGANDRINVGVIGVGGRGSYLCDQFAKHGLAHNSCQVVAVCDVYEKRKREAAEKHNAKGYLDYREVIARPDIDAIVVATPDHWHAQIALAAMDAGKDVYCEKPMTHTIDEALKLSSTVKETKRVLQVGSQTTSALQWHKAKEAIAEGRIGHMVGSQGSYNRNSIKGEWNYPIDPGTGPDAKGDNYIDWKTWLGSAPKRAYDADRFFRFRKYWDYSGGIATDLFFHVVAPMNICWPAPEFPARVSAMGGIYVFKDEREVPDTFNLLADFPSGHTLNLEASMANSHHIPGLIRGHLGTLVMVDHGMFEGKTDHITVTPERRVIDADYKAKFGETETVIPIEPEDAMQKHVGNFLDCMHTRQKPTLDVDTALHAQVTISMAVQSYREGRVLYWDERAMKVVNKAPKA